MIEDGFKRRNVTIQCCKEVERSTKSQNEMEADTATPNDLDWSYIFSNDRLRTITKTLNIAIFCKKQHIQYIALTTRLGNNALQKGLLFTVDHQIHARDRWLKCENELNITNGQILKIMQSKTEFLSLLNRIY